jgi:hypothetical protein
MLTNFNAEAEGIRSDDIVARLAAMIPQDPKALGEGRVFEPAFKTA